MYLVHNIGIRWNSNYNTREEIMDCEGPLSFDGVYLTVWENRDVLVDRAPILFVMGDYVGGDNAFDAGMPRERYCDWAQLRELVDAYGCRLGWHSWSHRNLCELSDAEVVKEVQRPDGFDASTMPYFAYPYGNVDARVARLVEEAGYTEAWSVFQGDGSKFQRPRRYLNW